AFALFLGAGAGTAGLGWLISVGGYTPLVVGCGAGLLLVTAAARVTWSRGRHPTCTAPTGEAVPVVRR
ncbi:MAG: hypothetical protein ACRDI2_02780, partial [Chloroflexota bacterium]